MFLLFILLVEVTTKRNMLKEPKLEMVNNKKSVLVYRAAPPESAEAEPVIEKFAETLMSSERYLRTIVNVERKLVHLEKRFRERSNSIVKYLTEILRLMKRAENIESERPPTMNYPPPTRQRNFEDRSSLFGKLIFI